MLNFPHILLHIKPQKWVGIIVPFLLAVIISGCGSDGSFRLNGKIEGFGTGNLRVVYFDKGAVQNMTATAVDGKFAVDARVSSPVMVRLYTGNGRLLGAFNASAGDNLEGKFSTESVAGMEISGNDDSERVSKFLKANADAITCGNHNSLNAAIADYVTNNPHRHASGTLLSTYFYVPGNEAKVVELVELLSDDVVKTASLRGLSDLTRSLAQPTDSILFEAFTVVDRKGNQLEINPKKTERTLVVFSNKDSRISDSIQQLTRELGKAERPKVKIFDISADADTAIWLESLRNIQKVDSLKSCLDKVQQGWTPNPYGIMGLEDITIARIPWFIVADSTSRVLYLGSSAAEAEKFTLK